MEQDQNLNLSDLSSIYLNLLGQFNETNDIELLPLSPLKENKRRRIEKDHNDSSNVKAVAMVAQYLLSRIPLPTTRSDLHKKFIKSANHKLKLDTILDEVNNHLQSILGLGILCSDIEKKKSSNPKYYVVQLCSHRSHINALCQLKSIHPNALGELTAEGYSDNIVSSYKCNAFINFISFLFGFFDVTSKDISTSQDSCVSNKDNTIEIHIEKIKNELDILLSSKINIVTIDEEDTESTNSQHSPLSIMLQVIYRCGYIIPIFNQSKVPNSRNTKHCISGFIPGPLLYWNSSSIKKILVEYS
ncbi:uncharacterized protein CMU_035390 [Cryptosporidium muris RN66]|uniref:Uncharacterized protein n=1 Tax=Cryptosporidium muris (strain RN66) TaxID=441375 RepID=B6AGM6_CRYMR|nr:uncharacterized protein CMU_035390 [Cryptosporidium muris RN66]EEA07367.1 hypothetical protein, conserved [Cryptosporidium muris RN66]|eukprot:XP_002141716.1 hypothetical protein [Cryptosporidium muris RN66]